MIIEEIDKKRYSYIKKIANEYDEEKIRQLAFDFTSNYRESDYMNHINWEYRTIYKNKDGKLIVKTTTYKPNTSHGERAEIGYINGYGHQLIEKYQQYKFMF